MLRKDPVVQADSATTFRCLSLGWASLGLLALLPPVGLGARSLCSEAVPLDRRHSDPPNLAPSGVSPLREGSSSSEGAGRGARLKVVPLRVEPEDERVLLLDPVVRPGEVKHRDVRPGGDSGNHPGMG